MTLFFKQSVFKDLKKINKQDVEIIKTKIDELRNNPFTKGQTEKLKGLENCYRIRSGQYRIIYGVNTDKKEIIILRVAHRKDVYDF